MAETVASNIPLLTEFETAHISERQALPERYLGLPNAEMDARIAAARQTLGRRLLILGHHYQRDEVIKFADNTGDSFRLAREVASRPNADYIVFCGVHFMAESADVLGAPHQHVILPDLAAGCSMADMAAADQLENCWEELTQMGVAGVVPVTYINSAAAIKAFVGEGGWHGLHVIQCGGDVELGVRARREGSLPAGSASRSQHCVQDGHCARRDGGVGSARDFRWPRSGPDAARAKMILWKGHCSVHTRFSVEQIEGIRKQYPGVARHRPSGGAVGRCRGRRRQRQHGVHHQDRHQESSRFHLGRWHRGPPRESSRERSRAGANRPFARSVRLPVLNDVPRVAESSPVDTGRACGGPDPQPHRGA